MTTAAQFSRCECACSKGACDAGWRLLRSRLFHRCTPFQALSYSPRPSLPPLIPCLPKSCLWTQRRKLLAVLSDKAQTQSKCPSSLWRCVCVLRIVSDCVRVSISMLRRKRKKELKVVRFCLRDTVESEIFVRNHLHVLEHSHAQPRVRKLVHTQCLSPLTAPLTCCLPLSFLSQSCVHV